MRNKRLYLYWLYLFIICAALGFIQQRSPFGIAMLALLTAGFFVPPALLLYRADLRGDRQTLKRIAGISALSLGLTTLAFIGSTLTVLAPENVLLGNILQAVLTVVSSPMMCAPYQGVSLFLWACLMITALSRLKKAKK